MGYCLGVLCPELLLKPSHPLIGAIVGPKFVGDIAQAHVSHHEGEARITRPPSNPPEFPLADQVHRKPVEWTIFELTFVNIDHVRVINLSREFTQIIGERIVGRAVVAKLKCVLTDITTK